MTDSSGYSVSRVRLSGRFLSDDERVVRIAARQMAASMALLERIESSEPGPIHRRQHAMHPTGASTVKRYKADDSIFIDDAYLIKGIAGRILWKLLQSTPKVGGWTLRIRKSGWMPVCSCLTSKTTWKRD